MIITRNVIKSNFIVMFFTFLFYEVILMTCLVLLYYQQLNKNDSNIENQITETSSEILHSYEYFLSEQTKIINNDLSLIGADLSMHKKTNANPGVVINVGSLFSQSYPDCLVEGFSTNDFEQPYYDMFNNKLELNPIKTIRQKYLKNMNTNNEIIDALSKIKSLNKIVAFKKIKEEDKKLCNLQMIFKTILIKSILLDKSSTAFNNIFIFSESNAFVYPSNNLSEEFLKEFFGNEAIDLGKLKDKFDTLVAGDDDTTAYLINSNLFVWSCIQPKLSDLNSYYICLQNDLDSIIQEIVMPNSQSDIASIKIRPKAENTKFTEIIILASPNHTVDEMNYFASKSQILGNQFSNDKEMHLFHLIYLEIFKHKNSVLTDNEVKQLLKEYNEVIIPKFETALVELKATEDKTIHLSIPQTFLDSNYNIYGQLNKGK